jgi:phosphoribosylformylglycinamidine (FGAM) synthase-like amidotransferase family enzyme
MPHPERACEGALGSGDGLVVFESVVAALASAGSVRA